ncbi:2420_t:CDS:2 [Acaulospora morrowiae]|uniref:2420_t:CDS:1 n=1 Tax=Acaulospora morrowiae TaxID=94023 RepID=A0A9N9F8R7_9GLOM|nr:2420_t:CDS:2 [Acaulospora morrowiae]
MFLVHVPNPVTQKQFVLELRGYSKRIRIQLCDTRGILEKEHTIIREILLAQTFYSFYWKKNLKDSPFDLHRPSYLFAGIVIIAAITNVTFFFSPPTPLNLTNLCILGSSAPFYNNGESPTPTILMVQLINRFSLSCKDSDHIDNESGVTILMSCTCEFRINSSNCVESYILRTAYWALIPYATLIAATSAWFLWYRIYYKGQSLTFPSSRDRGILRPRPHDAFHLVVVSFTLLSIIRYIFLLNDAYPNNSVAEVMDDLPRQISFLCGVLYCIGIKPSNDHFKKLTPNKHLVDVGGLCLMLGPFLVNTPISYMTGYFAENDRLDIANMLFITHYVVWCVWILMYLSALLYFWKKLSSLLKYHMSELKKRIKKDIRSQWKLETLEAAMTNLSTVVVVFTIVGLFLLILFLTFGVRRKTITQNNYYTNLSYFFIWNFVEPLFLQIAQFIIVYNVIKPSPVSIQLKPAELEKQAFAMVFENINRPVSEVRQSALTSSKVHPICSVVTNSTKSCSAVTDSTSPGGYAPSKKNTEQVTPEPSSAETKYPGRHRSLGVTSDTSTTCYSPGESNSVDSSKRHNEPTIGCGSSQNLDEQYSINSSIPSSLRNSRHLSFGRSLHLSNLPGQNLLKHPETYIEIQESIESHLMNYSEDDVSNRKSWLQDKPRRSRQ